MSIRTRFGSEVEIVCGSRETGRCDVKRLSDGRIFRDQDLVGLRADRGHVEIDAAITKASRTISGRPAGLVRRPLL